MPCGGLRAAAPAGVRHPRRLGELRHALAPEVPPVAPLVELEVGHEGRGLGPVVRPRSRPGPRPRPPPRDVVEHHPDGAPRRRHVDDHVPEPLERQHDRAQVLERPRHLARVDDAVDPVRRRRDPGDQQRGEEQQRALRVRPRGRVKVGVPRLRRRRPLGEPPLVAGYWPGRGSDGRVFAGGRVRCYRHKVGRARIMRWPFGGRARGRRFSLRREGVALGNLLEHLAGDRHLGRLHGKGVIDRKWLGVVGAAEIT